MPLDLPREAAKTEPRRSSMLAQIRQDIGCVRARDPAAGGKLEVILTYPGVHAVIWYRIANRLWRGGWRFPARFTSWLARVLTNVDIHPGATIGSGFFIDHGAGVVIGETAEIGDNVTLYHGVTLGGTSWAPGKRHPTVEDGVLIGCGAKILGPITIGTGARVGANSVVVDSVPPRMTVIGIPGRIVVDPSERRIVGGRIDLSHHLMPDPVGEALSELLDRLEFLEARLAHRERPWREAKRAGPDQEVMP